MNDREVQISEDILDLAVAFYREPNRYRNLLDARAARDDDVQILLRAAIGSGPGVSRELRSAALFAIEQLFFTQGANHYQILGLTADANIDQVKLHHRFLMRLLHPDRSDARQTWMDAYAGRVNQAYNVLRKPGLRQAYDHTLESIQIDRASSQAHREWDDNPPMPQRLAPERPSSLQRHTPGLIKHLPQLVLSVVAVLALLFVFWSYLTNRAFFVAVRTDAVLADGDRVVAPPPIFENLFSDTKPNSPVQDLNQRWLVRDPRWVLDRQAEQAAVIVPAEDAGDTVEILEAHMETPVVAEGPVWEPESPGVQGESGPEHETRQEMAVGPEQGSQAAEKAIITARQDQHRETQSRQANLRMASKAQEPTQGQDQETRVSTHALQALLRRFTETYNRGDLAGFMTLFDARARTSSHYGKPAIRKDYEGFFSTTASRRLSLSGMQWHREGAFASGRGRFQVRIKMGGSGKVHYSRGTIHFEVSKRKGTVKIRGVYHEMN